MRMVVLDTNALLMPYQFDINIERELNRLLGVCRIIVPRSVVEEVEKLAEKGGEVGRAAQLALSIIKKKNFRVIETDMKGDDGVIETAIKMEAAILTNDKELKKKAKEMRLCVIYLREGEKLEMEEIP